MLSLPIFPPSKHRLRIVDQDALRSVLEAVYEKHDNNQLNAAEFLGISQESFSKLRNGKHESMSYGTYSSIIEALGGQAVAFGPTPDPILEFVPDPSDLEIEREGYHARKEEREPRDVRADRELGALAAADLFARFESSVLSLEGQFTWSNYERWLETELQSLEMRVEPVLQELWDHQPAKRLIQAFLQQKGRGLELPEREDKRCWLALYRSVEPLVAAVATWGVERGWEEMEKAGDLKDFLKSSLKRETILWNRERDVDRMRRGKPPIEYSAWLAGVGEPDYEENNPVAGAEFFGDLLELGEEEEEEEEEEEGGK